MSQNASILSYSGGIDIADDGKVEFLYSEIYSLTENTTEIIKDNKIVRKLHQLFK